LLPFVEETAVYSQYPPVFDPKTVKASYAPGDPTGQNNAISNFPQAQQNKVSIFRCPSETSSDGTVVFDSHTWGSASYAANWQVFHISPRIPDSLKRGSSKTVLFTEKQSQCPITNPVGGSLWAMRGPTQTAPLPTWAAMIGYETIKDSTGNAKAYVVNPANLSQHIFQLPTDQCQWNLAQTPHGGQAINCGMGDGSVHTITHGTTTWDVALWVSPPNGKDLPLDDNWGAN
jgi:prepilin-type processing-associated H-X9-DG protein